MDQSFKHTDGEEDSDGKDTNVRFIQQIRIRIGEAKNLLPKNGGNGFKDCYCTIFLDHEEIFRTHYSVEKTLDPFFGEEFFFDIPRVFRFLSIHLYEREKTVNSLRSRPLGKVSIRRDFMQNFPYEESWFPLVPINQCEVQGSIYLGIEPEYIFNTNSLRITVNVYECRDLSNDYCDSYVVLSFNIFNEITEKKSKVKKKTTNPYYNESFCFEMALDKYSTFMNQNSQLILDNIMNSSRLKIHVHDSKSRSFMGGVQIFFNKLQINSLHKAWYYLQPDSVAQPFKCGPNLGSLRLRINYISDFVFSSPFYENLRNLLISSIETKPITSSVIHIIGEFALNKADAAQPLVKIFLHYKKIVPFIKYLAEDEISRVTDVNIIFRGNSLVSKCIDELMKLVGIRYLHETLKNCVDLVIVELKSCEIDPLKIKDRESLETNMSNLKSYATIFFNSIISSVKRCPQVMTEVFNVLKDLALKIFVDNKDVCYYVISGFVFLRFFAPSILNPRLFELTDKQINSQTNRTFTLISKTIQSIGNLVVSKKNTPLIKENYMTSFYRDFITEAHVSKTKKFLDSISLSSPSRLTTKENQEPMILKESIMFKKSNAYKRIGLSSTKKRYFCITTQHFYYAKSKNKPPVFKFPINEIVVKKLTDNYHLKNTFQVIHNKCTVHIQASNCVQEREWLSLLERLIHLNNFNKSIQSSSENVKNFITPDLSIKLDPNRELERIYSLLAGNMENIQLIIDSCEQSHIVKIWKGSSKNYVAHFVIEDHSTMLSTLMSLKECICQLNLIHKNYFSSILGSELAPIETD